jgi:hypothetical protein
LGYNKGSIDFQEASMPKEKLKTIYHTRISYPELNKNGKAEEKETTIKTNENGTSTDSSEKESNREEK